MRSALSKFTLDDTGSEDDLAAGILHSDLESQNEDILIIIGPMILNSKNLLSLVRLLR